MRSPCCLCTPRYQYWMPETNPDDTLYVLIFMAIQSITTTYVINHCNRSVWLYPI
jgi:hypothetical protein